MIERGPTFGIPRAHRRTKAVTFDRHPPDTGCDAGGPSCLRCPLPQCIYDEDGWLGKEARRQRDAEILRLRLHHGVSIEELRVAFGLGERTIQRAIHGR